MCITGYSTAVQETKLPPGGRQVHGDSGRKWWEGSLIFSIDLTPEIMPEQAAASSPLCFQHPRALYLVLEHMPLCCLAQSSSFGHLGTQSPNFTAGHIWLWQDFALIGKASSSLSRGPYTQFNHTAVCFQVLCTE